MNYRKLDAGNSSDVVLVSLPFGVLQSPSLALGILQARLCAAGIGTITRHFTLDYAARVGTTLYDRIGSGFPRTTDLLGEWIFSHAMTPKTREQQESYLRRTFTADHLRSAGDGAVATESGTRKGQLLETILGLASTAGEFVDHAAREILRHSPKVVGLTTVFQQNMASLAVAARLRQLAPGLKIVMGGANCEGPMGRELARAFPFIDYIVSGEADLVIVPLVQSLLAGEEPRLHPTVGARVETETAGGSFIQTAMVANLDDYLSPSFDDYFRDLHRLWSDKSEIRVHLPLETSRGCWWGMKNHCTFCGLNGASMAFRSRPPAAALREIVETAAKHPGSKICFVDNIMDYRYFEQLLPNLAQLGGDLDLFYEIKSNVTKPQVKALKDAGVKHVQPGIESLSDEVLRIMKKGVRTAQNIQLLKWCTEFRIAVDWNLLWGFPGENPIEYRKMADLVPLLCHLQPPARGSEIRLDRFSPNFTRSDEFGFFNVRPYPAYQDIYDGLSSQAVFNLSYFFLADSSVDEREIAAYTRDLADAIQTWRARHSASFLTYIESGGRVVLVDCRSMLDRKSAQTLEVLPSNIYLLCDSARGLASICRELPESSPNDIADALTQFCEDGTMWFDGDRYLSLAVSFTTFLESRSTSAVEDAVDALLSEGVSASSAEALAPAARGRPSRRPSTAPA